MSINTAQQIGGSIGTALLSTVFANAVPDYAAAHPGTGARIDAGVHGYTTVFWWAAALTAASAAVAFVLMRSTKAQLAAQTEWSQPAGAAVH